MVIKHYTEANNKYMLDYNEEKYILLMLYLGIKSNFKT